MSTHSQRNPDSPHSQWARMTGCLLPSSGAGGCSHTALRLPQHMARALAHCCGRPCAGWPWLTPNRASPLVAHAAVLAADVLAVHAEQHRCLGAQIHALPQGRAPGAHWSSPEVQGHNSELWATTHKCSKRDCSTRNSSYSTVASKKESLGALYPHRSRSALSASQGRQSRTRTNYDC